MKHYIKRWLLHKSAYLITEQKLTGTISMSGVLHDWEKPLLMLIFRDRKKVQKIHRKHSKHHVNGTTNEVRDPIGAVIDWECARITKPEMPLNARDTFNKFYPNAKGVAEALERLGL